MAVTAYVYNHTSALVAGQAITLSTLKVMLLSSSASVNAANTTLAQVAGTLTGGHYPNEVYGNGWPEGGKTLTTVAASTITTNDAKVTADQVSQTATGGPIGPCRYVLLYDATSSKPLIIYDLGQNEYAGDTTDFKMTFDLAGVVGSGTIFSLSV